MAKKTGLMDLIALVPASDIARPRKPWVWTPTR
jgi:hypothetical protein